MLGNKSFAISGGFFGGGVAAVGEKAFFTHAPTIADTNPVDTDAALLGGEGEDVDVVGSVGVVAVDKLLALDFAQGLDLVAVAGGMFEVERFGSLLHFGGEALQQAVGFAVEECGGHRERSNA